MCVQPASRSGGTSRSLSGATDSLASPAPACHQQRFEAAFQLHRAQQHVATDVMAAFLHVILLMLVVSRRLRSETAGQQLAATAVQLLLFTLPAVLAWHARNWYLRHRSLVVAPCLAASWFVLSACALPKSPPAWPGWVRFIAVLRCVGLNLLSWTMPLPLQIWLPTHLLGVAEAARLALRKVCRYPAFSGATAQAQYTAAAWRADYLSLLASPVGALGNLASSQQGDAPPTIFAATERGPCPCAQWALFVLATVGGALPVACQYVAHVAARKRFARSFCQQPECATCDAAKDADIPTLVATLTVMMAGLSAACWQLLDGAAKSGWLR